MATTSRAARRRTALVAVVTLSLTGLAAPALAAPAPAAPVRAESDDTVTITVDADALAALCDERLPQLVTRAEGLIERIQGGADVVGSSAWLTARADHASSVGHEDRATHLHERAAQRATRVDDLTAAIDRLQQVQDDVCSQVAP